MCSECVDQLQMRMDEAVLKSPPERLLVHIDDFGDSPHGELLSKDQVETDLHESWNERCWCNPVIIEPFDSRSAVEIVADYIHHDISERID